MSVYTIQNLHANIAAIPARVQSDLKSDYRYLQRMTMVIKTTRIEVCIINACYFVVVCKANSIFHPFEGFMSFCVMKFKFTLFCFEYCGFVVKCDATKTNITYRTHASQEKK